MDLIKKLKKPPSIIFTTTYSEFAAESYEINAVDYLVKPISFDRFSLSLNKYKALHYKADSETKDFILIKKNGMQQKLLLDNILFCEAKKDYVVFQTEQSKHMHLLAIVKLENILPKKQFQRIHRSFIVNVYKITSFNNRRIKIGDFEIPVGKKYKPII